MLRDRCQRRTMRLPIKRKKKAWTSSSKPSPDGRMPRAAKLVYAAFSVGMRAFLPQQHRLIALCVCGALCAFSVDAAHAAGRRTRDKPQAPLGRKLEGASGVPPKDGRCPETMSLTPRGSLLRMGPGANFGVHVVVEEDRCLP